MDNLDAQKEEILALKSIYDCKDLIVEQEEPPRGRFVAQVQLEGPLSVLCEQSSSTVSKCARHQIEYLPPISLFFEFPGSYPSRTCPAFLLSCCWMNLDQLSSVCRKLESLWEENGKEVILFQWINFLQNEILDFLRVKDTLDITKLSSYKFYSSFIREPSKNRNQRNREKPRFGHSRYKKNESHPISQKPRIVEALESSQKHSIASEASNALNESKCSDNESELTEADKMMVLNIKPSVFGGSRRFDSRAVLDLTDGGLLMPLLLRYNKMRKDEAFENSWVTCDICYARKKGCEFVSFSKCEHLYCKECLKSYFEVQIKDGNVLALNCPAEDCQSQADSGAVRQLVEDELFQKYDSLLLSRTLECMSDVAFCPRQACQSALITDPSNNMGSCPVCGFVFCLLCRMAYHGVAPCNLKTEEKQKISLRYIEGSAEERAELERQYGKRELKVIVDNVLSEEWLKSNSKKCPHCHTSIEKSEGCNKMTCYKCGTYFCWLCNSRLSPANPYSHYSDFTVPCYNQLFPEEQIDFEPGEFLEW